MQRRPRGVSQAFRDEEIHGEYEESKDEDDEEDELPRSTSFMANNLTRTLLAASERNPTSYMSKAMSTQGRAAKTFAKEFNPEPSKKQYNKARGLGKTATVVTTQLTSIYNALKGKDGRTTYKYKDLVADVSAAEVHERVGIVRRKLRDVARQKQKETGVYEDVKIESGLSVLVRWAAGANWV